jgi:hypothetical protein
VSERTEAELHTYVLGPFELLDLLFEPEDLDILVFAVSAFLFQVAKVFGVHFLAGGLLRHVLFVGHQALGVVEAFLHNSPLRLWSCRAVFNLVIEDEALDVLLDIALGLRVVLLLLKHLADQPAQLPIEFDHLLEVSVLGVEQILEVLAVLGTSDATEHLPVEDLVEELGVPARLAPLLDQLDGGQVLCSEHE